MKTRKYAAPAVKWLIKWEVETAKMDLIRDKRNDIHSWYLIDMLDQQRVVYFPKYK